MLFFDYFKGIDHYKYKHVYVFSISKEQLQKEKAALCLKRPSMSIRGLFFF